MTEKKKHEHDEEANENKAEAVATSCDVSEDMSSEMDMERLAADAEREALKKRLEEAEAKVSDYKDSWLRSQADFQNYKKRIERDNEMMYTSMKGDIIKKVLPALDDESSSSGAAAASCGRDLPALSAWWCVAARYRTTRQDRKRDSESEIQS